LKIPNHEKTGKPAGIKNIIQCKHRKTNREGKNESGNEGETQSKEGFPEGVAKEVTLESHHFKTKRNS